MKYIFIALAVAILLAISWILYFTPPCNGDYEFSIGGERYLLFKCKNQTEDIPPYAVDVEDNPNTPMIDANQPEGKSVPKKPLLEISNRGDLQSNPQPQQKAISGTHAHIPPSTNFWVIVEKISNQLIYIQGPIRLTEKGTWSHLLRIGTYGSPVHQEKFKLEIILADNELNERLLKTSKDTVPPHMLHGNINTFDEFIITRDRDKLADLIQKILRQHHREHPSYWLNEDGIRNVSKIDNEIGKKYKAQMDNIDPNLDEITKKLQEMHASGVLYGNKNNTRYKVSKQTDNKKLF